MINSRLIDKEFPVFFENKNECCGCTACYSICPKSAIQMVDDEEGFLYPQLISGKCVKCYLCIDICSYKIDMDYYKF